MNLTIQNIYEYVRISIPHVRMSDFIIYLKSALNYIGGKHKELYKLEKAFYEIETLSQYDDTSLLPSNCVAINRIYKTSADTLDEADALNSSEISTYSADDVSILFPAAGNYIVEFYAKTDIENEATDINIRDEFIQSLAEHIIATHYIAIDEKLYIRHLQAAETFAKAAVLAVTSNQKRNNRLRPIGG